MFLCVKKRGFFSGSKGQRSDSHVDQRTPLRAGPNLQNKKEKRWGRHWTSSNTSPESPPKQRRWRSLLDWNLNWSVVDLPLWKIGKPVGMIIPNIWKNKKHWRSLITYVIIKMIKSKWNITTVIKDISILSMTQTWHLYQWHLNKTKHELLRTYDWHKHDIYIHDI